MSQNFLDTIATDIKKIYRDDPADAENSIEDYLKIKLKDYSITDRLDVLDELVSTKYKSSPSQNKTKTFQNENDKCLESETLEELFSLILGKQILESDLPPQELLSRAISSLNTIFDTLNELMRMLYTSFFRKEFAPDETIRHKIHSHIINHSERSSLEVYLNQIKQTYGIVHKAFQEAVMVQIGVILKELNPENIKKEVEESGNLFGHLRKGRVFDKFEENYQKCKNWYEQGRCLKSFIIEFEKACQKLHNEQERIK